MRFRKPKETWHRDMVLSSGRIVTLEWQQLGRIEADKETLVEAPTGVVSIQGTLTDGEQHEIRERLLTERFPS